MSKFKIGDKVVPCYDEEYGGYHNYLVESEVYTVTSVKYGLIDIDGVMTPLAVGYGESCKFDWSEDWFKLADEQLLSNAFDNAVEEVGETFLANSLIERESEMNAEQIRDEILRIDLRIEEAKKDIESAEKERNSLVEKLRERGFELSGKIKATDGGYNVCTVDNVKEGDILILTEASWNNDIPTGSQVRVIKNDFSDVPLKIKTLDGLYEDWTKINTVKFK